MNTFKWNAEKNEKLSKERGEPFEEIVARIESGGKVVETDHPNKTRYPNQRILIVEKQQLIDLDEYEQKILDAFENRELKPVQSKTDFQAIARNTIKKNRKRRNSHPT